MQAAADSQCPYKASQGIQGLPGARFMWERFEADACPATAARPLLPTAHRQSKGDPSEKTGEGGLTRLCTMQTSLASSHIYLLVYTELWLWGHLETFPQRESPAVYVSCSSTRWSRGWGGGNRKVGGQRNWQGTRRWKKQSTAPVPCFAATEPWGQAPHACHRIRVRPGFPKATKHSVLLCSSCCVHCIQPISPFPAPFPSLGILPLLRASVPRAAFQGCHPLTPSVSKTTLPSCCLLQPSFSLAWSPWKWVSNSYCIQSTCIGPHLVWSPPLHEQPPVVSPLHELRFVC